jgi:hypothetical protein
LLQEKLSRKLPTLVGESVNAGIVKFWEKMGEEIFFNLVCAGDIYLDAEACDANFG